MKKDGTMERHSTAKPINTITTLYGFIESWGWIDAKEKR